MKKVFFSFLFVLFLLSVNLLGQKKMYFCSDYTATGEPIGSSSIWSISSKGGNVYMVYKNGGVNISTPVIYVFIDKLNSSNEYKEYDTKSLVPYKFMNWALFDYKFKEAGEYKVRLLDDLFTELTTEYVSVKMKDESGNSYSTNTEEKLDWSYYTGSKIYFCADVSAGGDPIKPSEVFDIPSTGAYTWVLVKPFKDLKTGQFIVDIYKGDNYKDFVETKYIDVTPSSQWAYFKYTFYSKGNYKFLIYNKSSIPIGTGYVTINVK